jgi:hypothetical protein
MGITIGQVDGARWRLLYGHWHEWVHISDGATQRGPCHSEGGLPFALPGKTTKGVRTKSWTLQDKSHLVLLGDATWVQGIVSATFIVAAARVFENLPAVCVPETLRMCTWLNPCQWARLPKPGG